MAKHERTSPVARRAKILLALGRRRDDVEHVDVALVGGVEVQRDRPEDRIARRLEDDSLLEMGKTLAAEFLGAVDAEEACSFRRRIEIAAQILGDAMMPPARVLLEGDDFLAHECGHAVA